MKHRTRRRHLVGLLLRLQAQLVGVGQRVAPESAHIYSSYGKIIVRVFKPHLFHCTIQPPTSSRSHSPTQWGAQPSFRKKVHRSKPHIDTNDHMKHATFGILSRLYLSLLQGPFQAVVHGCILVHDFVVDNFWDVDLCFWIFISAVMVTGRSPPR